MRVNTDKLRPVADFFIVLFFGAALGLSSAKAEDAGSPDDLTSLLETWLKGVRCLSADFEQVYQHPLAKKPRVSKGKIEIKRPGLVRLDWKSPEHRLIIIGKTEAISYDPGDKQVLRGQKDAVMDASIFLFLGDTADLDEDFYARKLIETQGKEGLEPLMVLELSPRKPSSAYARLLVTFKTRPVRILRVVAVEPNGGLNAFTLRNVKINEGLSDKRFEFATPPGVREIPITPQKR